jgi:DNA-binding YbaB/EbfC family protein
MNPKQLMKQVQQMQEQMQKRMAELRVEGSAGGGMVKATMNGNKEVLSVSIDKEAVDPNDVEMLQDLRDDRRNEDSGALLTAPPLANLINVLTKLPGVGAKSASRIAYHILKRTPAEAEELATAILDVKAKVFRCSNCNNMTDVDPCAICGDPRRDPSVICVVEEAFNIATIEQTRDFRGLFHVLLGALSPL